MRKCVKCGLERDQDEGLCVCERASGCASVTCYTADQQLKILCEVLRNITNGTTHLHESNFDHAALDFEVAASKLRQLGECQAV